MGLFSFLRTKKDGTTEPVQKLVEGRRTRRVGMDKNLRVGKVKYVTNAHTGPLHVLVDVLEYCSEHGGDPYQARYNLCVYVPESWKRNVRRSLVGKYIVFGFYMQAFRNKDLDQSYNNVLTLKFINVIDTEAEAKALALDISEASLFIEHPLLKLSNINTRKWQEDQIN